MQAALESVDGVEEVSVDFASGTATVTASADIDPKELIKALEEANFGGTIE